MRSEGVHVQRGEHVSVVTSSGPGDTGNVNQPHCISSCSAAHPVDPTPYLVSACRLQTTQASGLPREPAGSE
jgi:hypothetical protein